MHDMHKTLSLKIIFCDLFPDYEVDNTFLLPQPFLYNYRMHDFTDISFMLYSLALCYLNLLSNDKFNEYAFSLQGTIL
jgi:hypothetical protein